MRYNRLLNDAGALTGEALNIGNLYGEIGTVQQNFHFANLGSVVVIEKGIFEKMSENYEQLALWKMRVNNSVKTIAEASELCN